jgi:hypothetical protein
MGVYGSALFASALFKLYRLTGEQKYLNDAYFLLDFLKRNSLKKIYSEYCWGGHYFDVQYPNLEQKTNDAATIGTVACALPFLEDYAITKRKESLEIVESAINFMISNLYVEEKNKFFFKYLVKNKTNSTIYNASAYGVMLLANTYRYNQNENYVAISNKIMNYILSKQKSNGSWYFSEINEKERIQIDFHQGFILDGIYDFIRYTIPNEKKYMNALLKGAKFYKNEQFLQDGRCKWRYPHLWPIDIQNQAQGIITFSKLSDIRLEYLEFAKTIAKWTIDNMQDEKGYFYYQKWPLLTNKIPYIRWAQASMMLALATLLERLKKY